MRVIKITAMLVALTGVVLSVFVYVILTKSLAALDGEVVFTSLNSAVKVERDGQGIPTVIARSRVDAAAALGFLHAQERFFQMDLLRRNSAGELSELFGEVALDYDKRIRVHQFRQRAEQAVKTFPPGDFALLSAYAEGVNHGLHSLGARPFEYWLLQSVPKPWREEDVLLCLYSMYIDLQPSRGTYDRSLAFMRDRLPEDWFEFIKPRPANTWEAPIVGSFNHPIEVPSTPLRDIVAQTHVEDGHVEDNRGLFADQGMLGSNSWGVSGEATESGAAMIANDMHLGLRVPNIWYRASWFGEKDGRRITGATLPGTPLMIIGSNEHVAWGYTNSVGDWSDVIRLIVNDEQTHYLTPHGWQAFVEVEENIKVGSKNHLLHFKKTEWGPVIGHDHDGNLIAYRWVAHDDEAANLGLFSMENASTAQQALDAMAGAGVPHQNLLVADRNGELAWSIAGPMPRRGENHSQGYLYDWSQASSHWQGYLQASEFPRIFADETPYLWTANARVVDEPMLSLVGDGGYDIGVRASRIRELLALKTQFSEQDFLAMQLDTFNPVINQWQTVFTRAVKQLDADIQKEILDIMVGWKGTADRDSLSYPLVKRFYTKVKEKTLGSLFSYLMSEQYEGFNLKRVDNHLDNALWLLVSEKSQQTLNPSYESWDALLASSAKEAYIELMEEGGGVLPSQGEINTLSIRHPLSRALPFLSPLLDMPGDFVAGDRHNVVLAQGNDFGASQRMVVSPGNEGQGFFHMATGQSSHPLSPFYRAGHEDWVNGNASAFLPGQTSYTLILSPE